MNNNRYRLDNSRPTKRWHCPSCGKMEFKRYLDQATGEYLADAVGRCNREHNCGYHFTPREFFKAHPDLEIGNALYRRVPISKPDSEPEKKEISTIPLTVFAQSLNRYECNHFTQYLQRLFHQHLTPSLIARFQIGTAKHWPGATVFWQIDVLGNIRTGKIMLYSPLTGKRIKEPQARISWVHSVLRLPDYQLSQCLFGEHQLCHGPIDKAIAVVESEKTAVLMSALLPRYTWLATGGLHNLSPERFQCLKNREVLLFPDLNAFESWKAKAAALQPLCKSVVVSDLLERMSTSNDRIHGLDLADYSIISDPVTNCALTESGYPVFWDFPAFDDAKHPPNLRNTTAFSL